MTTVTNGKATELITFTRGTLATVTDSDGKIKWAPHNLLTNSESFDASSWTKTTTTVASNSVASPAGPTNAETLTAGGANSTVLQSYTSLGVAYTFGVWLKRKTGTGNIQIAADSGTYTTVTITSDWALYTVSQTPAAGTISAGIRIVTSGDEVYAWGAHLYRSDLGGMQANTSAYPMYNPTTPKNLLGYSEAFDVTSSGWTKSGLAATPVITNTIAAPNGSLTADKIVENSSASTHYIAQSAGTLQTSPYTFTVYAKAAERSFVSLGFDGLNAWFNLATGVKGTVEAGLTADMVSVGDGWYRCWVRRTVAVSGAKTCAVYIANADNAVSYTGDGTSGIYLWGAQLSDSASLDPYVPNFGAAPSAAAYHGPRLDYDPVTLSARGLLVEEARTNLLQRSQEFDTTWSALSGSGGATVSANTTLSPDGSNNADTLVEGSASGYQAIQQTISLSSGTTYTASVFVKAGTQNYVIVDCYEGSATYASAAFNLSNGTVHGSQASGTGYSIVGTPSITQSANGYYRCSFSFVAGTAAPTRFLISASTNGTISSFGLNVYQGASGNALVLYGAQLEAGSFATSYIQNINSPSGVTRNADVASVGVSQFPYSATEGTLVLAHDFLNPEQSTAYYYPGSIGDAQSTPYMVMGFYGNGVPFTQVPGTSLGTSLGYSSAASKIGIAFTGASQSGSRDGGAASSSSMTATLSAANLMRIAGGMYGLGNYSGHIRQITYIPRRLTNAELQSRTL